MFLLESETASVKDMFVKWAWRFCFAVKKGITFLFSSSFKVSSAKQSFSINIESESLRHILITEEWIWFGSLMKDYRKQKEREGKFSRRKSLTIIDFYWNKWWCWQQSCLHKCSNLIISVALEDWQRSRCKPNFVGEEQTLMGKGMCHIVLNSGVLSLQAQCSPWVVAT